MKISPKFLIECDFFSKKISTKIYVLIFLTFKGKKEEKYIIDFEEKFLKISFVDFNSIF